MWQQEIRIAGPYHFERALRRLAADPIKVIDLENKTIKVPLVIDKNPYAITVKSVGTVTEPHFSISGEVKDEHKSIVLKEIRRVFQWDVPFENIYAHFEKKELGSLFQTLKGTPLVLDFDLYFSLMRSIIHQQLNMSFAHTLTARFVNAFGFEKDGVWFYPDPDAVSKLHYDQLTELQFSRRKAEYVIDTSKLIASGEVVLDEFHMMPDEEIIEKLVKIRGIGPWTAECLLLFALGRKSIFPMADIGIQNGLKKLYRLEKKPTKEQMGAWKKDWSPYETYVALYLWELVGDPNLIVGDDGQIVTA
ncbi:DNA-3-methyladenine glycosylase [Pueribacillus theae]|uniref:DNA-3-methyladenine glycosylase II n=1 Tax=Pueribacillus theae TaxID=2171751 RepID=A0A2U1JI56_9BACI|nr:DNA-3-methyladenine glycosylase [Pueribacillus theae]PWA04821.1 DNA-3-methyladenine glycosylase [Pueribacillus theae]